MIIIYKREKSFCTAACFCTGERCELIIIVLRGEEREWLEAHPPLESEEAVIANFKQKHQASEYLEDAIHIYNLKYN